MSQHNNSISIDLENLQTQYSNLIIKYKSAVSNYITFLNEDLTTKTLVNVKGHAYTGSGSAGQSTANSLQKCQASCLENTKCTGATFISGQCDIRTGDTPLIASSNDSYAIVPKGKYLLTIMEDINNEMINVNNKILEKIDLLQPVYKTYYNNNNEMSQNLQKQYNNLMEERNNIKHLLNQYNTLDSVQNENELRVTQQYYYYIILVIAFIFFVFILLKMVASSGSSNSSTFSTS
jgi:hypothetical protein